MSLLHRIRIFHATLAVLVVITYLTAEVGTIHDWLGYAVAVAILFRIVWMTTGLPQLGLQRFYPSFEGLRLGNALTHPAISKTLLLGIAASLTITTITGIAMDRGRTLRLAQTAIMTPALADDDDRKQESGSGEDGLLEELHETMGNLLMMIIAVHVGYLLLAKRPLALFMLFVGSTKSKPKPNQDNSG